MGDEKLVQATVYEGFNIQSSASLRDSLWYPAYEISKNGEIVSPWRAPDIDGRGSEAAACEWGTELAVADIDIGLKTIFG